MLLDNKPEELDAPKKRSLWKFILKQVLLAIFVGGVILAIYLMIVNESKDDALVGKFAYISKSGEFVGEIKGKGRSIKSGSDVYYIKQPTGEIIELSTSYVEVRDKRPSLDD